MRETHRRQLGGAARESSLTERETRRRADAARRARAPGGGGPGARARGVPRAAPGGARGATARPRRDFRDRTHVRVCLLSVYSRLRIDRGVYTFADIPHSPHAHRRAAQARGRGGGWRGARGPSPHTHRLGGSCGGSRITLERDSRHWPLGGTLKPTSGLRAEPERGAPLVSAVPQQTAADAGRGRRRPEKRPPLAWR